MPQEKKAVARTDRARLASRRVLDPICSMAVPLRARRDGFYSPGRLPID